MLSWIGNPWSLDITSETMHLFFIYVSVRPAGALRSSFSIPCSGSSVVFQLEWTLFSPGSSVGGVWLASPGPWLCTWRQLSCKEVRDRPSRGRCLSHPSASSSSLWAADQQNALVRWSRPVERWSAWCVRESVWHCCSLERRTSSMWRDVLSADGRTSCVSLIRLGVSHCPLQFARTDVRCSRKKH